MKLSSYSFLYPLQFVFTKQPYLKSIATLERSRTKRDKTLSATSNEKISAKSAEKNAKKIQRAQDEYAEACAGNLLYVSTDYA